MLVIDDDPMQQAIFDAYFVQRGTEKISKAYNGARAKECLERAIDEIDLIVSDLHMPDFDGIEFLEYLREIECRIPLVIVSGADRTLVFSAQALAKAYALNIIGALPKPLDTQVLEGMTCHPGS